MPYFAQAEPKGKHPTLVKELVRELKRPPQKGGPRIPKKRRVAVPIIVEEEQRLTDRLHVYVIWDKWKAVEDTERGAVILDAYEQALGREKALQVILAMGVTPQEAGTLGIV